MTAAVNPRNTPSSGTTPARASVPIAANTLCLQGTIAVRDGNGRAANVGAGLPAIGIYSNTYDNRTSALYSSGAAGEINAEIEFGEFELPYTGTAPKMGQVLFNVDNQTVSLDSSGGTRGVAGFAVQPADTDAGTVRVFIAPHASGAYIDASAVSSIANDADAKADDLAVVELPIPLNSFRLASGAAIPAFTNNSADGFELTASKALSLRLNNTSTTEFWSQVKLPDDLDTGSAVEVHFLASRVGSTDTTAAITVTCFLQDAGAAYDAGSDLSSGDTGAIAGATKVSSDVQVTITGATAGAVLSISAKATAALANDDMVIHGAWVKCTRAVG